MTFVALIFAIALGFLTARAISRLRGKRQFMALTEYWVYLPGTQMPEQKEIMHRMLAANPYGKPGVSPIGHAEGLLFSDIRLHIALVLRSRNSHIFRPDFFGENVRASNEQANALNDSKSLVKVRYVSETALPDKRQIKFAVHAADAIAELADGSVIYDLPGEKLINKAELEAHLKRDPAGDDPGFHIRVVWKELMEGWIAETRGLKKIGMEELVTTTMGSDERVLVSQVLEDAAAAIWRTGSLPPSLEITAYDDTFRIHPQPIKHGLLPVKILRVQSQ